MNNKSLSRDADNAKSSIEDVIDNLILEIEELEGKIDELSKTLEETRESYERQIENLTDEIQDLQEKVDQNNSDNYRKY